MKEPTRKEVWVFLVEYPASQHDDAVHYVLDTAAEDVSVQLAQRLPFPAPPKSLDPTLVA
jgi:hypothetical protein